MAGLVASLLISRHSSASPQLFGPFPTIFHSARSSSGGIFIYEEAIDHLASLAPRQVRARHPAFACTGSSTENPSPRRRVHRSCERSLGVCHGSGLKNPMLACLPKFDTDISVWRRILSPGFNTVILHHGIASGSTGIITSSTRILRPSRAIHSETITGIISLLVRTHGVFGVLSMNQSMRDDLRPHPVSCFENHLQKKLERLE